MSYLAYYHVLCVGLPFQVFRNFSQSKTLQPGLLINTSYRESITFRLQWLPWLLVSFQAQFNVSVMI